MDETPTVCFDATAQAFKDGQLSFENFIDINLGHFSGERHPEDDVRTDESLANLSWLGNMGRVSAAIKACILEPGFVAPPGMLLTPKRVMNVTDKLLSAFTAPHFTGLRFGKSPSFEIFGQLNEVTSRHIGV